MKKYLLTILAIAFCVATTSAQERLIEVKDLPQTSQAFVKKHFSDEKVSVVTMEKEGVSTEYKVVFKSGAKVEFNKSGEWTDVESKRNNAVPAAIVPSNISTYVKARFPGEKIVKIEKDKRTTDVKLSNKLELKFNSKGEMVEIDS